MPKNAALDGESAPAEIVDIVRKLGATVQNVRKLVLESEKRLYAVENDVLELVRDASYANKDHASAPQHNGASLHVAAMEDLQRLGEETGMQDLARHKVAKATFMFTCPP